MSLLHRTSSTESFGRRTSSASQVTLRRPSALHDFTENGATTSKLSFNPLKSGKSLGDEVDHGVGAFEVPPRKRIAQVTIAVIYCLFAAGVVFGYAALKPILISEGIYRELCTAQEQKRGVEVCYKQELRMNLMFTIAAVATNVCALPVGTILDRYGPRVSSLIGACFITIGALLLAFSSVLRQSMPGFDSYVLGYLCLALGGPFVFIASFQLSNTFPQRSGLILALLTGAFDTSSAVFLGYRLLYTATNGSFKPRQFFLVYLIVPVFIIITNLTIMPATSYQTVGELLESAEVAREEDHALARSGTNDRNGLNETTAITPLISRSSSRRPSATASELTALLGAPDASTQRTSSQVIEKRSGISGALHGQSATSQVLSWWFVLITLFTLLQMTRINYFISTIRSQYSFLLHSTSAAKSVNGFFDVALPLGGVIAVPFTGVVLDYAPTALVLVVLVFFATLIGILGIIENSVTAAYLNIILFVAYRPFYYTTISDYAAKVFGFETFGKVYGLIICISGLFNFSQSGLDRLTLDTFRGDPRPVNIGLTSVAGLVGVVLVGFVAYQGRRIRREQVEREAEDATVERMPGADPRVGRDRHSDGLRHGEREYGT